ncbi:hypothetical protein L1987_01925 [Smallanthus sonchifolius]|uniref:Uncharacterized protein n=1 Tax=Smallanthus sonchifolius TaxID=185202 RepID=A0ACB9K6E2_9ASTR|nr:hypothetical protein L1987_01925 [Smallanthus sonchifolius]
MAEIMELMEVERKEAEEMEASVAVEKESTTAVALMAIGEAQSSSSEDDSPKKDESSSKANSTSSEEYITASVDGSVNTCPEGVVSEELLTEQKVHKNIITNGDNCILTEPDIIETNDKLKNLQKYYTPKKQTEKGQTPVHKPTPPAHNGELSKARSNEPYKRTHVDKRMCFHCGMVGHILVNCPSKNQGKRHVVSQPAVIPKLPIVKPPRSPKQNVVKPPVQPMGKPKIKSEAKPSVARKVRLPRVSTSGNNHLINDCMPCKKGKQQRKSHKPKLQKSIDTPLELLHMDLFGPISIRSIGGTRHEFSAPYTPQQNGVAERKNRTLIETARTMLSDAKLPVTFWAEAVNTACHVLNRVLVVKRHNKTCYDLINNRLPNLDYLVSFGSPCSLLLQYKDRQSKFHAKAVEGIFLGYVANSPCKRVYNIGTRTVEEWFEVDCSKHSTPPEPKGPAWGFDYDALFNFSTRATVPIITPDSNAASVSGTHDSDDSEDVLVDGDDAPANPNTTIGNEAPADPINIESSSSGTQEMGELSTNLDPEIQEPIVPETRVHMNHPIDNIIGGPYAGVQTRHRTIIENTSLYTEIFDTGVMETCLHAAFVSQLEPKNVKEALTDNCWIEAMQDELSQFQKLHVWDLVDLLKGFQPIGTRWVFKCKTDDHHVVVKNKARLVVQGFYQQEGLDYTEVYALVARIEAIRLFLAYATYVGFKVYQLDVKSAFLYGKVHEEVYVTQPPGFEDPHNINKVYKLDKALYGLHQAPRAWYETLSKHLLSNGFDRGRIDSTLFIRKAGGDILLVQVYVDNIIFGSTNEGMCREFEKVMKSKFEMRNMGELSFFLGLQVSQRENGIYLHQTKYVQDILSKYKMSDGTTYGTPIPVNHGLHPDRDGKDVDSRLYRGMIGSLMYLTASRPDIMFAVCLCSRFQSQPKESHMIAVKRIFRYLKGKPQLGLWYSKQQSFDFKAYTDSDYGGCNLDRNSTSGGWQFLGDRLVSWQCKKQSTHLRDYGLNFTGTPLFIDNNATISITNNPVKHSKTKHIEILHHFIRDCAEKHLIELEKVHTDDNLADIFTKAFDRSRFEHLVNLIGMFNPE